MTLAEAYKTLDLTPLDDFIDQQASWNREHHLPFHQGIGATTWMLVSAALKMRRDSVLLIDPTPKPPHPLLPQLKGILKGLGFTASWDMGMSVKCLKFNNHRAFCSDGRGKHPFFGPIFHDYDWKAKATVKAELGPFGRVHEIRRKSAPWDEPGSDQYLAFGMDNRFLFELTGRGAHDLARRNTEITTVGWSV